MNELLNIRNVKTGEEFQLTQAGWDNLKGSTDRDNFELVSDKAPSKSEAKTETTAPKAENEVNATEAAIGLAKENGVSISSITGSGAEGRITKGDVQSYIDQNQSK